MFSFLVCVFTMKLQNISHMKIIEIEAKSKQRKEKTIKIMLQLVGFWYVNLMHLHHLIWLFVVMYLIAKMWSLNYIKLSERCLFYGAVQSKCICSCLVLSSPNAKWIYARDLWACEFDDGMKKTLKFSKKPVWRLRWQRTGDREQDWTMKSVRGHDLK